MKQTMCVLPLVLVIFAQIANIFRYIEKTEERHASLLNILSCPSVLAVTPSALVDAQMLENGSRFWSI